jgi:isopentenyldiphosphate isomerase
VRSWDDVHHVCASLGVVLRPHGNGLVFEDVEQGLIQARTQRQDAWDSYRHAAARERQELKQKYRRQRNVINALPVSARDRGQLVRQLALRQTMETRALRRKLAIQRKAIQKTWHPGTWRHFVAGRAAHRDARAIHLRKRRERERGRSSEGREL